VARQERVLKTTEVVKIVSLLASTEMSIPEIAERFCCSRRAVVSINRRFHVRNYDRKRTRWALSSNYIKNKELRRKSAS
jgi:hypothetical protein